MISRQKPLLKLALLMLTAGTISLIGWHGSIVGLAAIPLFVGLWSASGGKAQAFFISLAYFATVDRGLIKGAGVFFADQTQAATYSLPWGLAIWLLPPLVLSGVWAACWAEKHVAWRAILATGICAVPPVGLIGWGSPLTAAGSWFPGAGFLGLILLCLVLGLIAEVPHAEKARRTHSLTSIAGLMVIAMLANLIAPGKPQAPIGWIGVNTRIGKSDDFYAMTTLQGKVGEQVSKGTKVVVLPETVGGNWDRNDIHWQFLSEAMQQRKQSALIGALSRTPAGTWQNTIVGIGALTGTRLVERVPVPISMWRPWDSENHIEANWLGSGVDTVGSNRVVSLVCYEQLLIWPALISASHHPDTLIAIMNGWWAKDTSIPAIQQMATQSWARLFNWKLVMAVNS
ncbi:nitrilase-related carbon-nitrogen hydrolase [Chromobacterium vaccinii]|uniref:nitrilase-related carbon-nitrogen hydrolase n=1 Tax=Chromobacterium vaccinii TaxID=1108595 RepID=UPI003C72BAD5